MSSGCLLGKKPGGCEACADVKAHDTGINNESYRYTNLGHFIFGAVQQDSAGEAAHAELCYKKLSITGVEKGGH